MPPILSRTANLFAFAAGIVAAACALVTVASIFGRQFASAPVPGDIEVTQFGIAIAVSLCLPWCQLRGANINADFFTQRASERTQARLDAIGALLLAGMTLLLAWRSVVGALSVAEFGETSMILGWPTWISYAALAPGLALTAAIAVVQAARRWNGAPLVGDDDAPAAAAAEAPTAPAAVAHGGAK